MDVDGPAPRPGRAPNAAGGGREHAATPYNYVVTAHRPTRVSHATVGAFTGPGDVNLIVAKFSRLEIHTLKEASIEPLLDVPIYGRICVLELFRPPGYQQDLLFITTERYRFMVLAYDKATGKLSTKASGDVQDTVGRDVDDGLRGLVDPQCRLIALHIYEGLVKAIPVDGRGQLKEAFNMRIDELSIRSLAFLHGCRQPTLAVLYEDTKEQLHLKTYVVDLQEKELAPGPWAQAHLNRFAHSLVAVPAPLGGLLVLGDEAVFYFNAAGEMVQHPHQRALKASCALTPDGTRYLLSDNVGALHLLALTPPAQGSSTGNAVQLALSKLGVASPAASLAYLDSGYVYVGSGDHDSQIVRLHPGPAENTVEVVQSFTNLAPIVDFCLVDLERQGQGQLVTCSGTLNHGTLRLVRNGIGIDEEAVIELPGIKALWALKNFASSAEFDQYLVASFVGETSAFAIDAEDEFGEVEIPGFSMQERTLFCGNVGREHLLQVTPSAVRLVEPGSGMAVATWAPPEGAAITLAAGHGAQVVVAHSGHAVVYLEAGPGGVQEVSRARLDHEVSCLDLTPVAFEGTQASTSAEMKASLVAVGTWGTEALLLAVPGLGPVQREDLGGEFIARSVRLAVFDGVGYLLCGMGDGHLISFALDGVAGTLVNRKKVSLGVQPLELAPFRVGEASHVFAASDRPVVVHSSNQKLVYSNVNLRDVTHIARYHTEAFPDCLAIAQADSLIIGRSDEILKLHIRTVPLHEQPRRICHLDSVGMFGVVTIQLGAAGDAMDPCFLRLMDDQLLETVASFAFAPNENPGSVAAMRFAGDDQQYLVVGTGVVLPDEEEPTKGRVLVFKAVDRSLQLVAELKIKGCAYKMASLRGKLVAGVNNKVQLFAWTEGPNGARRLEHECSHNGHILAIHLSVQDDLILVGDLMKSMSLLQYRPEEKRLETVADDRETNWMTAVQFLSKEVFLGCECSYNLFTLKRDPQAATDEARAALECVGRFHVGEMINCIQKGSLVMQLPDSEVSKIPTYIFGTVNGAIGVVASLPEGLYRTLEKLQGCLTEVIKGVGGIDHAEWRSFFNEKGRALPASNFIDGDLVEAFLDLRRDRMEEVAEAMKMPLDDLTKLIEELRLH